MGYYGPYSCDNVFPELVWNRVKSVGQRAAKLPAVHSSFEEKIQNIAQEQSQHFVSNLKKDKVHF